MPTSSEAFATVEHSRASQLCVRKSLILACITVAASRDATRTIRTLNATRSAAHGVHGLLQVDCLASSAKFFECLADAATAAVVACDLRLPIQGNSADNSIRRHVGRDAILCN